MVLLDTCALLWWTLQPDRLSQAAGEKCHEIEEEGGFLSSISIWEIGLKVKKGQLDLGLPFEDYLHRLKKLSTLEILSVDTNIWVQNLNLEWEHRDPVDRTIVATALLWNLPLVTKDEIIRTFYKKSVW